MHMSARSLGLALGVAVLPVAGYGQVGYLTQAGEYSISGSLLGDQVHAAVAVGTNGGLVVWEDNFTDGSASGISARRLDGTFSGILSTFRVNELGEGPQGRPDVAMLDNGGAVVAWEGGAGANPDIYARFMTSAHTWVGGDVLVNSHTNDMQTEVAVAALGNGESVIVWSSHNQVSSTSLRDVYLQRFDATGGKLGTAQLVNTTTTLNQRNPAVARLSDGRFVIVWVHEQYLGQIGNPYRVALRGRVFSAVGAAQGSELAIDNTSSNVCANPSIAPTSDGGFLVAWSERDASNSSNNWDVVARKFSGAGVGGTPRVLNTHRHGDQFAPRAAALGSEVFVVWTSLLQDGSHEGVFGRFIQPDGTLYGPGEVQVNSTAVNKQMLPDVAGNGATRFVAVWSGFAGLSQGFDVFAQRFAPELDPLSPPAAPYAWAVSASKVSLTWPEMAGFDVASYEVYADGAVTPTATVPTNRWSMTGLAASSTHSFRLAYVLTDTRRSPLSAPATVTTYSPFLYSGIPVDWMAQYWGEEWPSANADSDGDGASNRSEFLAGTDPTDANSVLRSALTQTPQGMFLVWNTVPGRVYQVKHSSDFITWTDVGQPRFAAGSQDSLHVGAAGSGVFRVQLLID